MNDCLYKNKIKKMTPVLTILTVRIIVWSVGIPKATDPRSVIRPTRNRKNNIKCCIQNNKIIKKSTILYFNKKNQFVLCADPESFVRGSPTLTTFYLVDGMERRLKCH